MGREIPAIRIWPMSDKIAGFRGKTIERVQKEVFLKDLPKSGGRWRYRATGLNADPGTIILFQFKARIIASGVFLRDEKFETKIGGCTGAIYMDPASFRTFDPLDVADMRAIWPGFRGFGHAKQRLNPTLYGTLIRRLKHVAAPSRRSARSP